MAAVGLLKAKHTRPPAEEWMMRKLTLKLYRALGIVLLVSLAFSNAQAQSWQPLQHQPTFSASTALQLTDGTIFVHEYGGTHWWQLTPDNKGNYVKGTWTQRATLPSGYAPLYYTSAVLKDGRVLVEGGEYNNFSPVWTNKGAIYNPLTDKWTSVNPPAGWTTIGDAQNVILANGQLMLANCCTTQAALFNPQNLTWTATGTGKVDSNNEEGWTLLPDGTVLTVDCNNTADPTHAEKYIPATAEWLSAGSTIVHLPDTPGSHEIGPAVLMADGTVFATGGTGHNAVYHPPAKKRKPGKWTVAPDFPNIGGQLTVGDGPATWMSNGNVLVAASPGIFNNGTHFFEFDGSSLTEVPATPNAPAITSFEGRMLLLPSGQVLFTDGSQDVEIYTPSGVPDPSWAPAITSAPTSVTRGNTYKISGTQFNGLTQASMYGDDASAATNYPLVRITNHATGHVFYARTSGHSSMGVATGSNIVSTKFTVSAATETGDSDLEVVANGIASVPVGVNVQ